MHSKDPGTSIEKIRKGSIVVYNHFMIMTYPSYPRSYDPSLQVMRAKSKASHATSAWIHLPRLPGGTELYSFAIVTNVMEINPESSNMTDIDWHSNSISNIFQHPISQTTVWMYDSYTSFAWLCYVLVRWMVVTLIVVWPTWVFESQQFELSLSARIQAACSTQI